MDEPPGGGEQPDAGLRRLVIRRGKGGRYIVAFATTRGGFSQGERIAAGLMERFPMVAGVARLVEQAHGHAEKASTLAGAELVEEEVAGLRLTAGAASFLQVNTEQAEQLYMKVLELAAVVPGERALDLYCGAGAIALLLARAGARVTGVEANGEAVRSAERNAAENGLSSSRFLRGDVRRVLASMAYEGKRQALIVVNPPRAGLAKEVVGCAARLGPSRVIYVSCNPSTLARDLARFARHGFRTTDIAPFDMFPHTWHIEIVARLEKEEPGSE